MSTETRSLATDFGGILNISQLHTEITEDNSINPTLIGIDLTDDVVDINFDSELAVNEIIKLNVIIASHVPTPPVGKNVSNISIVNQDIESTTYVTISSFNFPGTDLWTNVTNIKIIGFMEEDGTSYDVKIYDITNGKVICSKNLTNEDEDICDLGTVSNLPTTSSIFEVWCRTNGTTIAHVKNVNIYYF